MLRKAIGKKDEKIMTSQEQEFIEGCKRNKINEYLAKDIFSKSNRLPNMGLINRILLLTHYYRIKRLSKDLFSCLLYGVCACF